ncbi:hypothetical protein VKT23_018704 [Stygiomarasmius scandens]|uniref:PLP-dependent transferase n=1 Tax=Marasmiellus scandens TaxID=2682957 RepID=A0ABR1IST4_9AGAR
MPSLPNYDEDLHQAVSAWFLGPRAENFGYLQQVLNTILVEQAQARNGYYPQDPKFITKEMQESPAFERQIMKLSVGVQALAQRLAQHHVPFWNPRYNGHMTNDTTLPGIAGYLTGMLFNPNNVAAEASPLTTWLEMKVGQELCEMVKYNTDPQNKDEPQAWGHITCDGTIANLESIWAARNLKFYPLSLLLAMERGSLGFLLNKFHVQTCEGTSKLLRDFTTWELLNIVPYEVLAIPDRLYTSLSEKTLLCLNNGSDVNILTGAAITGIGSENLINIKVDDGAHMAIGHLEDELNKCLYANPPCTVYTVVAIIGSTEHGACDPLGDIVKLREKFRKKGLSFVLHADGAWGTYFSTTLEQEGFRNGPDEEHHFVPSIALKPKTIESLRNLRFCDSITIDPHKSGYIQYPSGGLLYRDQRMRYLVTWTSPVVNRQGEESIGVYGIEGRQVEL